MIEIEEYRRDNQSSPFDEWFSSLSVPAASRVSTALVRLEMGNKRGDPHGANPQLQTHHRRTCSARP